MFATIRVIVTHPRKALSPGLFSYVKYTFLINQIAATELGDIDVIDCIIIEWLRDLCVSNSPRIAKQRVNGHTWINYQFAVDDLPLLKFANKSAFQKRLAKLILKGYFSSKNIKQKVYIKSTPKMDLLFSQPYPPGHGEGLNRIPQDTAPYPPGHGNRHDKTEVNRIPQDTNPYPITNTKENDLNISAAEAAQSHEKAQTGSTTGEGYKRALAVRDKLRERIQLRAPSPLVVANSLMLSEVFGTETG